MPCSTAKFTTAEIERAIRAESLFAAKALPPYGAVSSLPPRCSQSPDPVHHWFGLTYSAYFVMPRLALQTMPVDWQRRFVALMEECDDLDLRTPVYSVLRRDDRGRYTEDPWRNYRRGRASDCDPSWKKMEGRHDD